MGTGVSTWIWSPEDYRQSFHLDGNFPILQGLQEQLALAGIIDRRDQTFVR